MTGLKKLFLDAFTDNPLPGQEIPDLPISGLECDSRHVKKGFIFLAIRGVKQDGAAFIREAEERGACVIVGDRPAAEAGASGGVLYIQVADMRRAAAYLSAAYYGHPSKKLKMVGITGTNGKTTSAYLIEHLLKCENKKVGVMGTINTRYGSTEVPAKETTPGPLKIQQILSEMAAERCEVAVMEVSSHALDQQRTKGISFASALFTNLTQDHLDYHGSLEKYFECKAGLFLDLGPESHAILNADDPWVMKLQGRLSSKIITYGVQKPADLMAIQVHHRASSAEFRLGAMGTPENFLVKLPLTGLHNVYNALGALAVAQSLGLNLKTSALNLESFKGVPGRLEVLDEGQNFQVFIDFAHTPDGLENVLRSLLPHKTKRLILVFGCGGDRDRTKRPKMAAIAGEYCDHVFVTSDNPRSEDPLQITREVCAGFPQNFKQVTVILDRRKAVRQALMAARKGDIVLLAGKGHETTQIIGDQALVFSDREEARKVLSGH